MNRPYNEYGEILYLQEAAELCGVSHVTFSQWLVAGSPMGELVENIHYYRVGRNYRFIKRQLGLLFGIIKEG